MQLNYIALIIIAFIPLLIAWFWYKPNSIGSRISNERYHDIFQSFTLKKLIWAYILSYLLVYAYVNLIIHQTGFYELFFTDIMKGNKESLKIANDFLAKYGDKHRHFGHGVFHGIINTVFVALPFVGFFAILESKSKQYYFLHLGYWLITSAIVGGLISAFV